MTLALKAKENTNEIDLILNRQNTTVYLRKKDADNYSIRLWPDLDVYTLNIEGRNFEIATDGNSFIWDRGSNEIDMKANESYDITLDEASNKYIKVQVRTDLNLFWCHLFNFMLQQLYFILYNYTNGK